MDFLKVAFIILFVVVTVFTVKFPPSMHQPMILEDQDFVLTRVSDTITTENVPVTSSVNPVQTTQIVQEPIKTETIKKVITEYNKQQPVVVETTQPKKTEVKVTTKSNPQDQSQLDLLKKIMTNAENAQVVQQPISQGVQTRTETTRTVSQNPTTTKTQTATKTPTTTKTVETSQPKSSTNPYMTEQEEIIAWNIWRSNIQNQIMKDSNIDFAPLGTVFTFTFVVDKFGNVSNIKVECSVPSFMDVARNNVKPAIANLQKKPILNFPKGTRRTSTVVTGMFLIGTQTRYSTPANYSDYETVRY